MNTNNENLLRLSELSRRLIQVANKGDMEREDDECGVIFGIARDYGYKLQKLIDDEIVKLKSQNFWV